SPFTSELLREATDFGASPWRVQERIPPHLAVEPEAIDEGDLEIASPLALSVERAVVLALRNNRALRVQQLQPLIVGTFEELERARFDPVVEAELSTAHDRRRIISTATGE